MAATEIREDAAAVVLEEGDSLVYEVTVQGANATFRLNDTTSDPPARLLSNLDDPAEEFPDVVYRRVWPLPDDEVSTDRDHILGIVHLEGDKYTYRVTHRQVGPDALIIDIDYAGEDGEQDRKILNVLMPEDIG